MEEKENNIIKESAPVNKEQKIVLANEILPETLVIVPTLQRPLFPGMIVPVIFTEGKYSKSLLHLWNKASSRDVGFVLAKFQNDQHEPSKESFYNVGVVAKIIKLINNEDGSVQVLVNTLKRLSIKQFVQEEPQIVANVVYHEDVWDKDDTEIKAMTSSIISFLRDLLRLNPLFSEQLKILLSEINTNEPGKLADFACLMTSAEKEEIQKVLEAFDVKERMRKVLYLLKQESEVQAVKEKINKQIEDKVGKQQREYFLREQLKVIQEELGMKKDPKTAEIDKLKDKIKDLKLSEEAKEKFNEELEKLNLIDTHSPEFAVSFNYLDWLASLPWGKYSTDNYDIQRAKKVLEKEHYGLDDVKKRIIEFISVNKLKGSIGGSILCFVGPPGVGKTSLGKAIAKTLNREFYRFSLGGMRDEAEIKGHRRTYIGAMPGKIMQGLRRCKTANPVIMLDEVDKIGNSFQGDPASALLEVLDPDQNIEFVDHYCDVKFDLSKILFIVTANLLDTIPPALLDRMEVLRLSGYIIDDKIHIAKRHIIPRQLIENGLDKKRVKFTTQALKKIIVDYARESGVRNMEREIENILRKCATEIAENSRKKGFIITPKDVEKMLGHTKFSDDLLMKKPVPGVVMGLAWTANGGTTLYVEAINIKSKEKGFKQTGQLGAVMVESANIAYSYINSIAAEKYSIPENWFAENFIHLHVPAGATPKDGPSAGITMATSLLSLACGKVPKKNLAMTGEITLTGRVLPIGGVKEKTIAAKRANVKILILPSENKKDFEEIPAHIRKGLKVFYVDEFSQVAKIALGI